MRFVPNRVGLFILVEKILSFLLSSAFDPKFYDFLFRLNDQSVILEGVLTWTEEPHPWWWLGLE